MTIEQLDAVYKAQPFKPFTIHLADGDKHQVTHPELMWHTPKGRTIVISLGGERMAIIDLLLVTKTTYGNSATRRRRRGELLRSALPPAFVFAGANLLLFAAPRFGGRFDPRLRWAFHARLAGTATPR